MRRPARSRAVRRGRRAAIAVVSTLVAVAAGPSLADGADAALRELGGEFLAGSFAASPVRATRLGVHDHDHRLPDWSRDARRRRTATLRRQLDAAVALDGAGLSHDAELDRRVLEHAIRAELLELETLRPWRSNPMRAVQVLANGAASLVEREELPLAERLAALTARLEAAPRFLAVARRSLRPAAVPALWVELALTDARGTIVFLRDRMPRALAAQGLGRLPSTSREAFDRSRRRALEAVERSIRSLRDEIEPYARGSFALGAETLRRRLLYEEHIDLPLATLRRMNDDAIARYRDWVAREAARIDPDADPADVMAGIVADHPEADELIDVARGYVDDARRFVEARGLLTLPDAPAPTVRPTPEYARSGFASMSAPGPFEPAAGAAYYNVTTVDPAWAPRTRREHLTYFNRPGLLGIGIHEVMPGHWVQSLRQREVDSPLRRAFPSRTLVEGWAHYVEQMMIDEGLGDGDPAVRLGQLRRALQRHARWDAALSLHVDGLSIEAVVERYREIAYFAPFPALREVRRGTYDPTYLHYAFGRMRILELREALRERAATEGRPFSLREFHDRLLGLGLPIELAREALLAPAR